jgi:hypothetical protein
VTRDEALAAGAATVDALDLVCRARRRALVDVNGTIVSIPLILRNVLTQRIADEHQGARTPEPRASGARRLLYAARQELERLASPLTASGLRFRRKPTEGARILVVPRSDNHLRDLIPVMGELKRRRRVDVRWILFRRDLLASVVRSGDPAILVDPASATARLLGEVEDVVAGAALGALAAPITETIGANLPEVLATTRTLTRVIGWFRPSLLLAGNPCTFEGRLAIASARGKRIPTATIQHGWLMAGDPLWRNVPFDLICVWGTRARDALLGDGLEDRRIAVTGAPWLDGFRSSRRTGERPMILIALSGAGHLVGTDEHHRVVRRIYEATAAIPRLRWVFRLHPKDNPDVYRSIAASVPGANGEIVEARRTELTIHDQLRETSILVTGKSTSAVDAMVARVPVITIGRPPGEMVPDFVSAGATTHVTPNMDLSTIVRSLLDGGQDPRIAEQAREYVTSFYGEGDHATQRAATRLEELIAT